MLSQVWVETGVGLQVLSGEDEARYTFLAVRRWEAHSLSVLTDGRFEMGLGTGRPGIEEIQRRREEIGFSYFVVGADVSERIRAGRR